MRYVLIVTAAGAICGSAYYFAVAQEPDDRLAETAANTRKLHRVTEELFRMDDLAVFYCRPPSDNAPHNPHAKHYCHVFVNELGLAAMKTGKGVYPEGAVIVKQKFSDKAGKKTELFTLMRKRESEYDPEHGNWEYSIVDRTGKTVLSRGRTDSCIDCHAIYEKTDYVTRIYLKGQ